MIASPAFKTLAAVGGMLTLVVALLTPVPSSFDIRSGGRDIPAIDREICIAMKYSDSIEGQWLPRAFRLEPTLDAVFDRGGYRGHRAVGIPPTLGADLSGWRYTGHDSIDLSFHHSPVLRLPSRIVISPVGESVTGRAGNGQWNSLLITLLRNDHFTAGARAIACNQLPSHPNDR